MNCGILMFKSSVILTAALQWKKVYLLSLNSGKFEYCSTSMCCIVQDTNAMLTCWKYELTMQPMQPIAPTPKKTADVVAGVVLTSGNDEVAFVSGCRCSCLSFPSWDRSEWWGRTSQTCRSLTSHLFIEKEPAVFVLPLGSIVHFILN